MQGKNNISSQHCPSSFDFCHQEQNPVLQLAWGRKIRGSDFDFHLCPRANLGCVSDTHVNIVGVGLAGYAKGCHLTAPLLHNRSLYCFLEGYEKTLSV